jgi:hypothetical protein
MHRNQDSRLAVLAAREVNPVLKAYRHRGYDHLRNGSANPAQGLFSKPGTGARGWPRFAMRLAGFEPATRGLEVRCSVH